MIDFLGGLKTYLKQKFQNINVVLGSSLQNQDKTTVIISDVYSISIVSDKSFVVSVDIFGFGKKRDEVEGLLQDLVLSLHKKNIQNNMVYVKNGEFAFSNDVYQFKIVIEIFVLF